MSDCKKLKDSKNEYPKKIKKLLEEYNKYEERKKLDTSNYVPDILEKYKEPLKKKYKEKIEEKYKELLEKKYKEECEKQIEKKQIKEKDKKKCIKKLKKIYNKEFVFNGICRELIITYSYLENFEKWFEMFYGEKSKLFKKNGETNNEIVDAIFKYIYLDITIDDKELLSELKLSENFF